MRADYLVLLFAAPVSWVLILLTRRYVLWRGILDIPSERSSHSAPTPRGGGLGIVIVTVLGVLAAGAAGWISFPVVITLVGGGVAVAVVGWLDDTKGLSPTVRLATHFSAAVWALFTSRVREKTVLRVSRRHSRRPGPQSVSARP